MLKALVSDHPVLVHHVVAYESPFSYCEQSALVSTTVFWIPEVVAYESFDCTSKHPVETTFNR